MQFVNLAEAADGARGVFSELFKQYVFHRTSAPRLFVYTAYLVEGEVNFRTLTLLANSMLPLTLLLFYVSVRGERYRWIWLLVSALLLLHMRAHTIVLWCQPALAYYSVFFFAFASIFALHKVTVPKFLLAVILCTFSVLSFASGQIVWLLGFASLLHQCFISGRRSLLYPAIWLLIALVALILWWMGYTEVYWGFDTRTLPDQVSDAPFHQIVARYVAFFLVILGSAFTDSSTWVAGIAGLIVLAILSIVSLRFIKHEDIRLALCCWFVVATATAVVFGRAMWLSPEYVLERRYSFLGVILVSTLALLLQTRFKLFKTPAIYLVVLLVGSYWVWAHRYFESQVKESLQIRYSEFNAERFPVFAKSGSESAAIVEHAISEGIYKPPCRPLPVCETPALSAQ